MDQFLKANVIEVVEEVSGFDAVQMEDKLVEDLGMDSLDLASLCQSIEDEFEVEIDAKAFQGIETVGQLLEKVESLTGDAG